MIDFCLSEISCILKNIYKSCFLETIMGKGVWLWVGGAILVLVFLILALGNSTGTGYAIATNNTTDATPPVLYITSSYVNNNNYANVYGWAWDMESLVNYIHLAGPMEYTGMIRNSKSCYLNNCSFFLNFSYNPVYDTKGDTYRIYAGSSGGQATKDVVLKFNGENTSCTSECAQDGLLRCYGNYPQKCSDYDHNGCLEWSNSDYCTYGCVNGRCNTPPGNQTCNDSDGGKNYPVKGIVIYATPTGGDNYNDSCLDAQGYATYSSNSLGEGYCENNQPKSEIINCTSKGPYTGCVNGACVNTTDSCTPETPIVTCTRVFGAGYQCGTATNNCGQIISCGVCNSTSMCNAGTGKCITNPFIFDPFILVYSDQQYNGISPSIMDAIVLGDVQAYLRTRTVPIDSGIIKHLDLRTAYHHDRTVNVFGHGKQFTIMYPGNAYSILYAIEAGNLLTYLRQYVDNHPGIKVCNNIFDLSKLSNTTNLYPTLDACTSWYSGTIQPFCSDSDKNAQSPDGKNYYVLGTVSTQIGNYTDYCNTTGPSWLNEYYCSGNYSGVYPYNCPYGCNAGVCKTKPRVICKGFKCFFQKVLEAVSANRAS